MAKPIGEQKLASIVYKDFTFPFNPAKTSYKADRSYIKHKYPELDGTELEDLGINACVISGEGEFFGKDAYNNWRRLLQVYNEKGVGNVSHPIFTDVTRGLMVSLMANVEPTADYIRYTFDIVADTEPTINECLGRYIIVTSGSPNPPSGGTGVETSGGTSRGSKNEFVHTVVRGECLSVICARYASKYKTSISWKKIAKYNNMKNPNLIYPGDKIKIYYPT